MFPTRALLSPRTTAATAVVAVVAALAALASCASVPTRSVRAARTTPIAPAATVTRGPVSVGQCSGGSKDRTVTYSTIPQRIVTLDPQAAEFLVALGLSERIVASWAMYDERTLARLPQYAEQLRAIDNLGDGRGTNPSPQVIAALRPDVVVTTGRLDEPGSFDATALERLSGIPTFGFTNHCAGGVRSGPEPLLADIATLGLVFDASFLADQLRATLQGQFARATAVTHGSSALDAWLSGGDGGPSPATPDGLAALVLEPYATSGTVSVHLGEAVLELAGRRRALDAV